MFFRKPSKEIGDLRATFNTPQGKNALLYICKLCGLTEPSFVPESKDLTAWNEGKRFIALKLLQDLNRSDSEIREMYNEQITTEDHYNDR